MSCVATEVLSCVAANEMSCVAIEEVLCAATEDLSCVAEKKDVLCCSRITKKWTPQSNVQKSFFCIRVKDFAVFNSSTPMGPATPTLIYQDVSPNHSLHLVGLGWWGPLAHSKPPKCCNCCVFCPIGKSPTHPPKKKSEWSISGIQFSRLRRKSENPTKGIH